MSGVPKCQFFLTQNHDVMQGSYFPIFIPSRQLKILDNALNQTDNHGLETFHIQIYTQTHARTHAHTQCIYIYIYIALVHKLKNI